MLDPAKRLEPSARLNYDNTYSPAVVQEGNHLHYWPNITCASRDIAALRAKESIERLTVQEECLLWNVWPDIRAENE